MLQEINQILTKNDINPTKVLNIYMYGSRVYGTQSEESDYDFIGIVASSLKGKNELQIINGNINITLYTMEHFQNLLNQHYISALECYFLPKEFILKKETTIKMKIDLQTLRHSISHKASNSWVKAKKKLTVNKDYDPYCAKKSLFHSLRILMFGCQIATTGRISNYSEANFIWKRLQTLPDDWKIISDYFKASRNSLHSKFRVEAPKE